jgi:hypothetical protein
MELTPEVLKQLAAPFPASAISVKVQTKPNDKGNALCVAYIDARDVMDRLDEIVGGEWSDDYRAAPAGGLECALTVCGVTRRDVGVDDNQNNTKKAGYSDAFKRAAVKFGIGRFLYSLPKMYGRVKQFGNNFYLEDGEEDRLRQVVINALNGHGPKKAEDKKVVERQKEIVAEPRQSEGVSESHDELMKEHGALWHRAAVTPGLLTKENVAKWSCKAADTNETIQRKIGQLKEALEGVK